MDTMMEQTKAKVKKLRMDQYYDITAHHFGAGEEDGHATLMGGNYISRSFADNRL
jgi:hypothetical protein